MLEAVGQVRKVGAARGQVETKARGGATKCVSRDGLCELGFLVLHSEQEWSL